MEITTYALDIVHDIMFFAKLFRKNVEKGLDGNDRQKLCSFLLQKRMNKFAFGRESDLSGIDLKLFFVGKQLENPRINKTLK